AAHGLETDDLLAALASHTRFVDGKTFFFNEGVWIDSQAVTCPTLPKVTIRFGSEAYFDLLARHPEAGPWLALGQQVRLVLKTTLYEINN
ncbi:MAG: hypothetical protein N3G20_11200, partial [Verrucomicrobiae bacterium]|nr:hypothetical protein [Verrucomicrobiae bacterium]